MLFQPKLLKEKQGSFRLPERVEAKAHPCLGAAVLGELWQNFALGTSRVTVSPEKKYVFSVGHAEGLPLEGWEYSINVEKDGICLLAESETGLLHGFMTLLDRFEAVDREEGTAVEIAACEIRDRALLSGRMVHFCIFPETELWELSRFVRLCGFLRFTHIVLEFWGMLKYDCMRELAWREGYTKEEIRPIIAEARALGLEVIPMFNHWGHASAGRVMHGKHVVLDQNPLLQTYFSEDGWCWAIQKPKVRELLRSIRRELCELCGEGRYFHVGCDEAYDYDLNDPEQRAAICDFLNEISDELQEKGRTAIVWGDMFLYRHPHYNPENRYTCNAPTAECEREMLKRLSKRILVADWQYDAPHAPVETVSVFQRAGFKTVLCPWDRGQREVSAAVKTAYDEGLCGILHTTWHTLSCGIFRTVQAAVESFEGAREREDTRFYRLGCARILRRVQPAGGEYRRAGWAKKQVGEIR